MPTAPDLTAVKAYLGDGSSWPDSEVSSALAAETAAQLRVCRFPADPEPPADPLPYPDDLAEALKRRVARNLALRAIPLGLQTSMSEGAVAVSRIGADPEIRRLEAPFRKLVFG